VVKRLLSAAPFILKGEGWYVTDYPSESRKKARESEKSAGDKAEKSAGDKAEKSAGEKKDSAPAEKSSSPSSAPSTSASAPAVSKTPD
jgi:predicted nucleic acid-binding Zn ribbon protein